MFGGPFHIQVKLMVPHLEDTAVPFFGDRLLYGSSDHCNPCTALKANCVGHTDVPGDIAPIRSLPDPKLQSAILNSPMNFSTWVLALHSASASTSALRGRQWPSLRLQAQEVKYETTFTTYMATEAMMDGAVCLMCLMRLLMWLLAHAVDGGVDMDG